MVDRDPWSCSNEPWVEYDGLDRLWEDVNNWDRIDPTLEADGEKADVGNEADAQYIPTFRGDEADRVPRYAIDTIPPEHREPYLGEAEEFYRLQELLAKHLHYQYRATPELISIEPRLNFPDAGDLPNDN